MSDQGTAARVFRVKSANGRPPPRQFVRCCARCHADFLGLAFGKTGEAGIWNHTGRWWCSIECYDAEHGEGEADRLIAADLPPWLSAGRPVAHTEKGERR